VKVHGIRRLFSRRLVAAAALIALLAVLLTGRTAHSALAWQASATLYPNGSGTGTGAAATFSGAGGSLSVYIVGARPSAVYAVFSCQPLTGGDWDCAGKDNPPDFQQVLVAPKALSPVVLSLIQQGQLVTDPFGNGVANFDIPAALLPDSPHSIYNAVQLINTADATDSYTALTTQAPRQPIAGVNVIPNLEVSTAINTPVFVLAQFPGYAFPISITTLAGVPFTPTLAVPLNVFAGSPFAATVGLCPNGTAPHAVAVVGSGTVAFLC